MTIASTAAAPAGNAASVRRLAMFLVGGALLSKVLGLVREILVAHAIGASVIADSFRGGLTAILLPLIFLQNETVPAILIPAYRQWNEEGTAPQRFAALTAAMVLTGFLLFLLVEATAPFWIGVLLGGFGDHAQELTLSFTRVMALAMPGSVLLCCLSATEIARGQSRITSVRATLINVAVIAGVVLLLLTGRPVMLAWAFSLAFNIVSVWALIVVLREGALDLAGVRPSLIWHALTTYLQRLRPMVLQPVAENAQVWIERLLASALAVGTVASLDYARTLSDCAVLLVSQPLGLAVLSSGPSRDPRAQMNALARPVLAVAIPCSIFLCFFAPEIVTLVFHRGAFDEQAIASTSSVLRGIGAGLWAATLGWILVRMLNSAGRNRRATIVVATAYLANIVVSGLLVSRFGGLGLGLGEAIRGMVLLAGVACALGCGRHLMRLLLTMLPAAVLLVGIEAIVGAQVDGLLPRLVVGGAATAGVAGVSLWLLVPALRRRVGLLIGKVA